MATFCLEEYLLQYDQESRLFLRCFAVTVHVHSWLKPEVPEEGGEEPFAGWND